MAMSAIRRVVFFIIVSVYVFTCKYSVNKQNLTSYIRKYIVAGYDIQLFFEMEIKHRGNCYLRNARYNGEELTVDYTINFWLQQFRVVFSATFFCRAS